MHEFHTIAKDLLKKRTTKKTSMISYVLWMVHKERYPVYCYAPEMWNSYSGKFDL